MTITRQQSDMHVTKMILILFLAKMSFAFPVERHELFEPLGSGNNAWGMEGNHMVEEIEPVYYDLGLPQQDVEKRLIWTTRPKDKRAPFRDSFPTFKHSSSLQDRVSLAGRYGKRGSKYRSNDEKMALKYYPILFA